MVCSNSLHAFFWRIESSSRILCDSTEMILVCPASVSKTMGTQGCSNEFLRRRTTSKLESDCNAGRRKQKFSPFYRLSTHFTHKTQRKPEKAPPNTQQHSIVKHQQQQQQAKPNNKAVTALNHTQQSSNSNQYSIDDVQ